MSHLSGWCLFVSLLVTAAGTVKGFGPIPAANYRQSVVRVKNGGTFGSAVVICPDGHILTAGHVFRGVIGGKFDVNWVTGETGRATLLAVDRSRDLAIGKLDGVVRAYSPVATTKPSATGEFEAIGYPHSKGPSLRRVQYRRQSQKAEVPGQFRQWAEYEFVNVNVPQGHNAAVAKVHEGDSGGAVFDKHKRVVSIMCNSTGPIDWKSGHICSIRTTGPTLREIQQFFQQGQF